jgi:hypothetical protein
MTVKFAALPCLLGICFLCFATGQPPARHPYASEQPLTEPTIFGAGVISTGDYETHPAFTPDGQTLYFVKSTPTFSFWTIVVSRFVNGRWTEPEVAPFSGRYSDADPFITADGQQLYFISARPAPNAAPGAARINFYQQLLERLRTVPGVADAAAVTQPPLAGGGGWAMEVTIEGREALRRDIRCHAALLSNLGHPLAARPRFHCAGSRRRAAECDRQRNLRRAALAA